MFFVFLKTKLELCKLKYQVTVLLTHLCTPVSCFSTGHTPCERMGYWEGWTDTVAEHPESI